MRYYIVYKITNLINNKIYVGAHTTNNLDDRYMSSSKVVKRAIKKYGLEHFKKDILHHCDTEQDMFLKEADIVDKEFISRGDTYNLTEGGTGSWTHWNNGSTLHKETCKKAAKAVEQRFDLNDSGSGENTRFDNNEELRKRAFDASQSKEAQEKKKRTFAERKIGQGKNNSQFGTHLYTNGTIVKRHKEGSEPKRLDSLQLNIEEII